jgi:dCMP deaminase
MSHHNPTRRHEYDIAYMKMAMAMGSLSYAERKKVGAIIVSENDQVISQGFNGTPKGFDNCCEKVLEDGTLETLPEVLHAESNAIAKCAKFCTSAKNGTLYVTLSPCINCAKLIIQAEIKKVVYLEDYRDNTGLDLLRKCGVEVEKLSGIL